MLQISIKRYMFRVLAVLLLARTITVCISPRERDSGRGGSSGCGIWSRTQSCGRGCRRCGSCGPHATPAPGQSPVQGSWEPRSRGTAGVLKWLWARGAEVRQLPARRDLRESCNDKTIHDLALSSIKSSSYNSVTLAVCVRK